MPHADSRHPLGATRIGCLTVLLFLASCVAGTGAPEVTVSPTAAPPTSAPAFPAAVLNIANGPVFTLFPTTASAPTPSLSPSPTPTGTAVLSPSASVSGQETPSPSSTKSPPPGASDISTDACDNILYPLAAGRWWKYEIIRSDAVFTAEASVPAVYGNTASVDLLDQHLGTQSSFTVDCTEGALTGFSATEIGFLFFPPGTSLIVHTVSGMLAPAGNGLESADWDFAWATDLLASGQIHATVPPLGEVDMVFQDAPLHIEWRTAGAGAAAFEFVKVPAGVFPHALKVSADARYDLLAKVNVGGQDQMIPAVLELSASLWYQPGTGLVKQVFTSSRIMVSGSSRPLDFGAHMELAAFSFPD